MILFVKLPLTEAGNMEDYSMLFKEDNGPLIFPQKTYSYDFDFSPESEREYRLFFTGETELFYYWKTEYAPEHFTSCISDVLSPEKPPHGELNSKVQIIQRF